MDRTLERRQRRKEYVDQLLIESGIAQDMLAQSTQKHLEEWARQVQVFEDQPSANLDNAVVQLCKAVESELANLGRVKGLEFLTKDVPLGTKAKALQDFQSQLTTKRLAIVQIKLPPTLPTLLFSLAHLRKYSAHGGVAERTATKKEAQQARNLAGKILKQVIWAGKEQKSES